jgi:hypothetical protein
VTAGYDRNRVSIEKLPIEGIRIDRIHGKQYRVAPRFYAVKDGNLRTKGTWTIELHAKPVERSDGSVHEATVVKVALAPRHASIRMASITRQSIMIVPATRGKYAGLPYAHVTFREPDAFGGKRTASKGDKNALPDWFVRHYGRRIRLRETVQGKIQSEDVVGARLSKFHDIKQVVAFDAWEDEQFIRLFFLMRIFSAERAFKFDSLSHV